jgi:hypothetical protein
MDEKELLAGCVELTACDCANSSGISIPVVGSGEALGITMLAYGDTPAAVGVMAGIGVIYFYRN